MISHTRKIHTNLLNQQAQKKEENMTAIAKTEPFSITSEDNTDIWRKPPTTNRANGALLPLGEGTLTGFRSARISVLNDGWQHRYDQGGLYLQLSKPNSDALTSKWLKIGIEYFNDAPFISTVGTDQFSDWSIYPCEAKRGEYITVEVRREGDENGKALWAYLLTINTEGQITMRTPLREIAWFFSDEKDVALAAAAYCCRPATIESPASKELTAHFKDASVLFE